MVLRNWFALHHYPADLLFKFTLIVVVAPLTVDARRALAPGDVISSSRMVAVYRWSHTTPNELGLTVTAPEYAVHARHLLRARCEEI